MYEKSFTLEVQHTDEGEAYIQFPEETMAGLGWKEGDTVLQGQLGPLREGLRVIQSGERKP